MYYPDPLHPEFSKPPIDVPCVDPPAPVNFEREYRRPRRPVVLRGLLSERQLSRWSFAELAAEFADLNVPTHHTPTGIVAVDPEGGVTTESRVLADVLDELGGNGAPSLYMMARLDQVPVAWRDRITPPVYCAGARWFHSKLWLSPADMVSFLHRDTADNLHIQLVGRKRFTLIDSKESARLYPNSLFASMPNGCQVDLDAPDFIRYPRFRDTQMQQAELAPGDAAYIPRGTWHHVRTLADSLSVNFWWARGVWLPLVVGVDLFKKLRGISH